MKLFWISWYQPGEDYRPLTFPPNSAILGWWCSGYASDGAATLCAYVEAKSDDLAKVAVLNDWPEAEQDWRFCEERAWYTPSDRFHRSEWMTPRLQKWEAK